MRPGLLKVIMTLTYLLAISSTAVGCLDDEFSGDEDGTATWPSCCGIDTETSFPEPDTAWPDTDPDWPGTDPDSPDGCHNQFQICVDRCEMMDPVTDPTNCGCAPDDWNCDCAIAVPEDCYVMCEKDLDSCLNPHQDPCEKELSRCLEGCEGWDTETAWDCGCEDWEDCDCGMPEPGYCQDECYRMHTKCVQPVDPCDELVARCLEECSYSGDDRCFEDCFTMLDECHNPPVTNCNFEYHTCLDTCAWDDEWCHDRCYDDFFSCNVDQGKERCEIEYDDCTDTCEWDDHFCYEHCYEAFYVCMDRGGGECEVICDEGGCWEECWETDRETDWETEPDSDWDTDSAYPCETWCDENGCHEECLD